MTAPAKPAPTELDRVGSLPTDQRLPMLADYLIRARARTAEALAMRDAAMRELVGEGWSHRRVAEAAGVSVPTVRAVLR